MSTPAIVVENVGKRYLLQHHGRNNFNTLRDTLADWFRPRAESRGDRAFWALQDISLVIPKGRAVGLIGRNGAGKSTLLKILSRITAPTCGRVVFCGKVSSLLEVGTGFHPDLTGRENIYLNGAILGMSNADIRRRFEEIVSFAEVERFLDTPVKRYSSGMYMRLAFAVAAHLEPDTLLIDEVLAVGDVAFQKKCLGKIRTVTAHQGRTVVFVSHNLHAIQTLCSDAIYLKDGQIIDTGPTSGVIARYLAASEPACQERTWPISSAPGDDIARLLEIRVRSLTGDVPFISSSAGADVDFTVLVTTPATGLCVGFDLTAQDGTTVFRSYQTDVAVHEWPALTPGTSYLTATIPPGLLNGGRYFLSVRIGIHNQRWIVYEDHCVQFDVHRDHGQSPLWSDNERPGAIAPVLRWTDHTLGATHRATTHANS